MPIEIVIEKLPTLQIVSLRGRLDSAGTPTLRNSLEELVQSGEKRVVFDCAELRYVSSVGLGVFVTSAKALGAAGGKLYFASLSQHVRSVFEMVGFLGIFEVYPSVESAIESLQRQDPG